MVSAFFSTFASEIRNINDLIMYNEEVRTTMKFTKFNIFTRDGNKEVTAPRRMTLDEAMRHFKAFAISGIE